LLLNLDSTLIDSTRISPQMLRNFLRLLLKILLWRFKFFKILLILTIHFHRLIVRKILWVLLRYIKLIFKNWLLLIIWLNLLWLWSFWLLLRLLFIYFNILIYWRFLIKILLRWIMLKWLLVFLNVLLYRIILSYILWNLLTNNKLCMLRFLEGLI
jgi:hypothetical protein